MFHNFSFDLMQPSKAKNVCIFTMMNLSSMSWTAPLLAMSVRCVLEEQKRCKPLPEPAHLVGQVITQIECCRVRSCNKEVWISVHVTSGFEQVCTRLPIRLRVKSAAVAPFRSTGARRAVIFAQRIITAQWASSCIFKKEKLAYVQWQLMLSSPEPGCKPHPVSQRCILSLGQLGPQLLHGDFLP